SAPSSPVPWAQPVRARAATTMLVPAAAAPRRRTIIWLLVGAAGRTAGCPTPPWCSTASAVGCTDAASEAPPPSAHTSSRFSASRRGAHPAATRAPRHGARAGARRARHARGVTHEDGTTEPARGARARAAARRARGVLSAAQQRWVRHPRWSLAVRGAIAAALAWFVGVLAPEPFSDYPYYAPLGAVVATPSTLARSVRESVQAVLAILVGAAIARVVDLALYPSAASVALVV